jgi:hypothetical protein
MREFGIVALLSVIATAAAPTPPSPRVERYLTAKSTSDFASCYEKVQGPRSANWAYVASRRGGAAFSNFGEPGVRQPYFIQISDRGVRREVALQGAAPGGAEAKGVRQCL